MTDAAKAVEAKAKVLAEHPEAYAWERLEGPWEIWPDGSNDSIGGGATESEAWINTASRLTAVEEPVSATDIRRVFPASCEPPVYLDEHLRRIEEPAKPKEGKLVDVWRQEGGELIYAAPGDVREGATRWDCDSNHRGIAFMRECEAGPFVTYKSYLAALQQVAEKDEEIERLCSRCNSFNDQVNQLRNRAEAAEAELSRLRGELAKLQETPCPKNNNGHWFDSNGICDYCAVYDSENDLLKGRGELKERDK